MTAAARKNAGTLVIDRVIVSKPRIPRNRGMPDGLFPECARVLQSGSALLRFCGRCIKDVVIRGPDVRTPAAYKEVREKLMSDTMAARQNMVDCQVRPSDVTDLRIIDAMLTVPREAFVPKDRQALAYLDLDIDVGATADRSAFLIKPAVLARMLQAAAITATDRALIVGCATGYAAAIVARLAGEVVATESNPDIAAAARSALIGIGARHVGVVIAKAADGHADSGPYDVIVIDGATEIVPENLYRQLKIGGRLVGVFAVSTPARATIVTRSTADCGSRALFDATAPVLPGLERLPAFAF